MAFLIANCTFIENCPVSPKLKFCRAGVMKLPTDRLELYIVPINSQKPLLRFTTTDERFTSRTIFTRKEMDGPEFLFLVLVYQTDEQHNA